MARSKTVTLSLDEALELCTRAAVAAGASETAAASLARSAVAAEAEGQPTLGLSHFVDYLDALQQGRIDGAAVPAVTRPALAWFSVDARGGAAHTGFDMVFDDLVKAAQLFGVAVFAQKNGYTSGALGYFAGRLAEAGVAAIAAANGPPLMAGSGATRPVFCTNPMAFATPVADGPPLVIDQASSATAFVNIRKAAKAGEPIPEGWALDASGNPTTDAKEAVKGTLLAFGGAKGANIALMVDVLAAGLTGANWSLDAPPFDSGSESPGCGLFIIALSPSLFDADFQSRMKAQLERLRDGFGVHIPGLRGAAARREVAEAGLAVPKAVHDRIAAFEVG